MTVARPDISAAVIKLSQYAQNPAKIHYQALCHLMKYLALTKDCGIHYWQKELHMELPKIPPQSCISNNDVMHTIHHSTKPKTIHGYVDSDFGSDRNH